MAEEVRGRGRDGHGGGGLPAYQLVEASQNAQLVIVGRRSRKVPLGAHLGHVAHAVIHHSPAPVAVIPLV
ncbi:universal stress protein [Streptomyces sp. NPDC004787]|uniref:universal stress protein n=1 Tax=Streptomyces sp. NPDC004787 TaxID=3154291 RepID=UPI0033B1876C